MSERKEDVLKILYMTRRNLTILETQAAAMGVLAPPYIQIGIKEARNSIKDLENRYVLAGGTLPIPPDPENQVPDTQPTNPLVQTEPAKTVSIQPPNSGEKPARTKVFISYSHNDKEWLSYLQKHLKPYEQFGWTNKDGTKEKLERWDDTMIPVGSDWFAHIKKELDFTKVAVMLITSDFLYSQFITNVELTSFVEASLKEGLILFPVIVSASAYKNIWLGKYQSFNPPSAPLDQLSKPKREAEFVKLVEKIVEALKS